MAHSIYQRIHAPDASINNIGPSKVILQSSRPNTVTGIVCRDGTLAVASMNKTNVVPNDIELGIPDFDDLIITENTTYNSQNIINKLTIDGCVFTIAEVADLTVLSNVNLLNGGSIVGTYSTTPANGNLEILGEIDLHI